MYHAADWSAQFFSLFSRHCHVSLQKLYVPLTLFQKAGHAPIPTVSFCNRKLISMLCWGLAGYSNSWSLDQAKLHGTTLNPLLFYGAEEFVSSGHPVMLHLVAIIFNTLLLLDLVLTECGSESLLPNEVHFLITNFIILI